MNLLLTSAPSVELNAVEVTRMFLSLGVLLVSARAAGELARRAHQPAVLGEITAGVLLGPALLGRLAPDLSAWLFPGAGPTAVVLQGLCTLAVALFLLVAGLEVDLSRILRQGKAATLVSSMGIAVPFALGLSAALLVPRAVGFEEGQSRAIFTWFFATALSISALPVIARTLMDLYLYRTSFGMIVIAAAMLNDIVGWIVFAVILGMVGRPELADVAGAHPSAGNVIALTLAFTVLMLTLVRWAIHRALPWVQAHTAWPSGVIVFAMSLSMFSAGAAAWIGIHAIFGAFIAGIALGDSSHLRQRTRTTISEFVSSFFAPIFFASIGLTVDFAAHFDPVLTAAVIAVACLGKIVGCGIGARLAGMLPRESWAMGLALNARGSMEIILGSTARHTGLIGERLFVALVSMALFTSVISGPAIQRILGRKRPRRFAGLLSARAFVHPLHHRERRGVVRELSRAAARASGLDPERIDAAVWAREEAGSTGIGQGLAVPHARLEGLEGPVIALGLAREGIDFNAPDGESARIVFLILTPKDDPGAQLEILGDIGRTLKDPDIRDKVLAVASFTELLALVRSEPETHV